MPHYDPCDNYDGAFDPKSKPKTPTKRELTRLAKKAFGSKAWVDEGTYRISVCVGTASHFVLWSYDEKVVKSRAVDPPPSATRRRALEAALRVLAGEEP